MGLDMYAMVASEPILPETDFESPRQARELHVWQKHPHLHGLMQDLYYEKGGSEEWFNCVNVALRADDLDRLEARIKDGDRPDAILFFFGGSDGSEREDDLAFIAKARAEIAKGNSVYYTSWW
jgi:hypothetical protein